MRRIFFPAITIAISLALPAASVDAADNPTLFELSTTDVTIMNPDTLQVIGHGHYHVSHLVEGTDLFEGENNYLDGEHDSEVQRVERAANASPPILVSYQHSFFAADGAPESIDRLDAKSGAVSCTVYSDGAPQVHESKLAVPSDTYAGSTELMLLVGRLRQGARDITMHAFICLPGPRIVAIKVTPPTSTVKWPMYPGNLVKVELVPDLGWFGAIAGPFIPKSYGWFDPADDFNYVGGLFDRFYRRRHLLMVKTPPAPKVAQNR